MTKSLLHNLQHNDISTESTLDRKALLDMLIMHIDILETEVSNLYRRIAKLETKLLGDPE